MKNLILLVFFALTAIGCSHSVKKKMDAPVEKQKSAVSNSAKTKGATSTLSSKITCPKCGYSIEEKMPTEVCQISYTCKNCQTTLHPKEGDCCVFCTYGDHKCPSKQ